MLVRALFSVLHNIMMSLLKFSILPMSLSLASKESFPRLLILGESVYFLVHVLLQAVPLCLVRFRLRSFAFGPLLSKI